MPFGFGRPKYMDMQNLENKLFEKEGLPPETVEDRLALLRQKCSTLALDGQYEECQALLEENLALFYQYERWPQSFFQLLRLHKRCYAPTNEVPHTEYMPVLLRSNGIPAVFADLLAERDGSIVWSAEHFRTMALLSHGRGELEKALDYSELVIRLDPASSGAYTLRGQLWDAAGHVEEAIAMYREALALSPSNHLASVSLARHFMISSPPAALRYINAAIEQAPGEAGYLALKVSILLRMGEREEALRTCDEAIALDPYDPELPYQKAEILFENGQTVAAISQYRRVLTLNDKHIMTLLRLAALYEKRQPELALQYITTAVGLQPQNCDAGLLRASLLHHFGELDAAVAQYELVLTLDSTCHEALAGLGWIYLQRNFPARALESFDRAISFAPPLGSYLYGKGQAHVQLGANDDALRALESAAELDASEPGVFALMGQLLQEEDPGAAVACYRRALTLAPEHVGYLSACGRLLLQMSQPQQALLFLERAAQLAQGDAQVHLDFAQLLEQTGNTVSATVHYEAARTLAPEFYQAHYGLARLRCESDPAAALLHINRVIYLDGLRSAPYYWKAKILTVLAQNPQTWEHLPSLDAENDLDAEELRYLSEGQGMPLALRYLNRAVELAPDREEYLLAQADVLLALENPPRALEIYRKALHKQPENPAALFGIARAFAEQNDAQQALAYFDRALAVSPQQPLYHAHRAQLLGRNPDTYEQALAGFDRAIALEPESWEIMLQKARLLDTHKSVLEACKYYRRVLLLNDSCLEAATRMGILLAELLPHAALEYFALSLRLEPDNYRHHIWRGRVLWQISQQEEAQQAFDAALDIGKNGHEVCFAMAEILREILPEQAMEYCRKAHDQSPEEPEYNRLLGDLYLANNDIDEAVRCYDQALEYDTLNHGSHEKLAYILYLQRKPQSLIRIDRALMQRPDCLRCLLLKTKILDELHQNTIEAIECIGRAVKLAPEVVKYREKRIELLRKNKSFWRLHAERRRLRRLLRKLALPVSEATLSLQAKILQEQPEMHDT